MEERRKLIMKVKVLTFEQVNNFVNSLPVLKDRNNEFVYAIYLKCIGTIEEVRSEIVLKDFANLNHFDIILYICGEYYYSTFNKNPEQLAAFHNETILNSIATVVTDKYLSLSNFAYRERNLTNKYLPTVSSLDVYLNFMLTILNNSAFKDEKYKLIHDLFSKSIKLCRCILSLLIDGNETEAYATWRTLHECECTLIILEKYKDKTLEAYLKHMRYGIAFKDNISDKDLQNQIFVELKKEMKDHDLKSKDMKKFIEYGWLYSIPNIDEFAGFKLNFRDGLQTLAGLSIYSKKYELSSEIIHCTPMLIYSNKTQYYYITLLSLYESFFRLEKIFVSLLSEKVTPEQMAAYKNLRNLYYTQLITIYKREVEAFQKLNKNI